MSMITCSECGKEISDKAQTCPNCGCPITPIVEGESNGNVNKKVKKKEAKLSLISCVIAGVAFICPLPVILSFPMFIVGLIIALIDLGEKDKTKSHTGSWFAIVAAIVNLMVTFL